MTDLKFSQLIALLVINKVDEFRDSYQLTKVLSRKFKVFEFVDLMETLFDSNFVSRTTNNGIHNYQITKSGISYLRDNKEWLENELAYRFPTESAFINELWLRPDIEKNDK